MLEKKNREETPWAMQRNDAHARAQGTLEDTLQWRFLSALYMCVCKVQKLINSASYSGAILHELRSSGMPSSCAKLLRLYILRWYDIVVYLLKREITAMI